MPIYSLESIFNGDNIFDFTADLRLRAEELLRYKLWFPEQIAG